MPRRPRLGFVNMSPQPSDSGSSDEADSDTSIPPAFLRGDRHSGILPNGNTLEWYSDMDESEASSDAFAYGGWEFDSEEGGEELGEGRMYRAGEARVQGRGVERGVCWDVLVAVAQTGAILVMIGVCARWIGRVQMMLVPRREVVDGWNVTAWEGM